MRRRPTLAGEGRWLLPSVLAFAAAFAWRDSATLRFLDTLAILVLLALVTLRSRAGRIRLAGLTDYLVAGLVSGVSALFGGLLLIFNDIGWKEIPRDGWSRHALAVLRGLAIGVPVVLVFGALFVAADSIYEGLVRSTFGFDSGVAVSHVLLFLAFAWLSAGFLRTAFVGQEPTPAGGGLPAHIALGFSDPVKPERKEEDTTSPDATADFKVESVTRERDEKGTGDVGASNAKHEGDADMFAPPSVTDESAQATVTPRTQADASAETAAPPGVTAAAAAVAPSRAGEPRVLPRRVSLGVVEVGVVLGLLNVLFMSFVFVQLRYFFGGSEVVLSSADMSYAEYARRGFFELAWVAALVLPLLLAVHWLLRKEDTAHERIFRALSGGLLLMLFVIMASAVGRMRLYQSEYGQTELRFYVTAFIAWLAVVCVWFALTVLRGERERFACGALVAALAIVGALHFVNPNAVIVRANAALAHDRRVFDAPYAASLGADAVPALVEALPEMRPHERGEVAANLLRWAASDGSDWRSWNWSRARASGAVTENWMMLKEWARQQQMPVGAEQQPPPPAPNDEPPQTAGVEQRRTANAGQSAGH
ncbi:MAG: DUF4173 domain-containing protein, partial [Acidobacteria bacterium]|nr:DUF4173 domain-containing protein [Acidobacteriota bacterium]